MKKHFIALAALALPAVSAFLPATANAQILLSISEVYGGGGNAGATYANDYIEIFNRGATSITLGGYSVQYASSTGTGWAVTALTAFTLDPGQYYLVQEASSGGVALALPTPNATGTINLSATAGKVALVSNTTALTGANPAGGPTVIDFVGYGSGTNGFEGTGPAPGGSNTASVIRAMGGAMDTNSNPADFAAGAPNPTAVPEPSTYAMMAGGIGLLMLGQRARRRAAGRA